MLSQRQAVIALFDEGFLALDLHRKGALLMVTWSDLFQLVIMIAAIATLFYTIGKRK